MCGAGLAHAVDAGFLLAGVAGVVALATVGAVGAQVDTGAATQGRSISGTGFAGTVDTALALAEIAGGVACAAVGVAGLRVDAVSAAEEETLVAGLAATFVDEAIAVVVLAVGADFLGGRGATGTFSPGVVGPTGLRPVFAGAFATLAREIQPASLFLAWLAAAARVIVDLAVAVVVDAIA